MVEAAGRKRRGINFISDVVTKDRLKGAGLIDEATGEFIRHYRVTEEEGARRFMESISDIACSMAQASITCDGNKGEGSSCIAAELKHMFIEAYINGFCDGAYNFGFARSDYKMRGAMGREGAVISYSPVFIDALDDEGSGSM